MSQERANHLYQKVNREIYGQVQDQPSEFALMPE